MTLMGTDCQRALLHLCLLCIPWTVFHSLVTLPKCLYILIWLKRTSDADSGFSLTSALVNVFNSFKDQKQKSLYTLWFPISNPNIEWFHIVVVTERQWGKPISSNTINNTACCVFIVFYSFFFYDYWPDYALWLHQQKMRMSPLQINERKNLCMHHTMKNDVSKKSVPEMLTAWFIRYSSFYSM